MASVFERGGRWYLRFKNAAGVWCQQVSTARTKTEARRLAGWGMTGECVARDGRLFLLAVGGQGNGY